MLCSVFSDVTRSVLAPQGLTLAFDRQSIINANGIVLLKGQYRYESAASRQSHATCLVCLAILVRLWLM